MASVIVGLLPLIVGAGVSPIWIIIVLLLLRNERGVLKAAAFVTGVTLVRLVQGILFGSIARASNEANAGGGSGLVVSTLLLVIGILMWVTAIKQWRKEDDPDAPPPKLMTSISGLSPARAFATGVLLMSIAAKQWVFTLSAVSVIGEAQLSQAQNIAAFLFYVLAAQTLILAPILIYAVRPAASAQKLAVAQDWLARNNRAITIAVSVIFGTLFLWKGIAGLIG